MAYLDTLERPANYTDDHHGRIIRRWRRKAQGVTHDAAGDMLDAYGRSAGYFLAWCERHSVTAVLRNRTGR